MKILLLFIDFVVIVIVVDFVVGAHVVTGNNRTLNLHESKKLGNFLCSFQNRNLKLL